LKLPTDPLKATQGPKNIPETKIERMMLISSQTFKVILHPSDTNYVKFEAAHPSLKP
jgi:hypothetical protein